MEKWADKELKTIDMGDKRLNERCRRLLECFAEDPVASIPAACRGWAETLAAYRFFSNEKVGEAKILAAHRDATLLRMAALPVALVAQDTTELDFSAQPNTQGLGPLNSETRVGMFAHPSLAISPDGRCLGTLAATIWAREALRDKRAYKKLPLEQKESARWLEGYALASEAAAELPETRVVSVSDREADIYELFLAPAQRRREGKACADWIVRAHQNRRLETDDSEVVCLRKRLAAAPILGVRHLDLSRTPKRSPRAALVTVRAVEGLAPRAPYRPGATLEPARINAVWLRETDAPAGTEPLDWLLLTSLPTAQLDDALRVADYYCCRWQIEVFFRVLKSGCRIEQLQLEKAERLRRCIALYLIVAWRVLHVMAQSREHPDSPCTTVFEEAEWKSVWCVTHQTREAPSDPPTLGEMVKWVATLGGYLARRSDPPPGPKALWVGLQRMAHFAQAWNLFGPERN